MAVAAALVVASSVAILGGVALLGDVNVNDADTPRPSGTPTGNGVQTGTPGDGSDTVGTRFTLVVDNVESCGTTCRDVTTTMTNAGDASASDISVRTTLFAGNSTDESDQVWEGTEDVGTLAAGESYTTTKRVQLSWGEAYAVQQADGWVTIRTTIRTAEGTVTLTERRNVT